MSREKRAAGSGRMKRKTQATPAGSVPADARDEIEEAMATLPDLSACERITLPEYRLEDPGIPFRVVLKNAVRVWRDPKTGEQAAISIPAFESLLAVLAIVRVHQPCRLTGPEIRFLRRAMETSAHALAEALHLKPETVSRCENGRQKLGEHSERLLRLLVVERLRERAPGTPIVRRDIIEMGLRQAPSEPLSFECEALRVKDKDRPEAPATESWETLPDAA